MTSDATSVVETRFPISKSKLAEFCQRHHVRKLSLFGSLLRDDFTPDSDVDVLLEFEPGVKVGLFKLYDLEQELSQLLRGRRVDINTPKSLSKYFRDQVLAEAEVLYVQA
jgi:predicted nucleotidyltransferase